MTVSLSLRRAFVAALVLAVLLPACAPTVRVPKIDDADYALPALKQGQFS